MNSKNDWIRDYLGVTAWHKAGYTGSRGCTLTAEEIEGAGKESHARKTLAVLHEIAPGRRVVYGDLTGGDVDRLVGQIESIGADSMYASISWYGGIGAWRKEIDSKLPAYCSLFVSAGNHSTDRDNPMMKAERVYGVGAVRLIASESRGGVPVPGADITPIEAGYTSASDHVDFAGVTDLYIGDNDRIFNGTSCACPVICGMAALVNDLAIARTGHPLDHDMLYRLLRDCARPINQPGVKDSRMGWGLPILPPPDELDIERYVRMETYKYKDDSSINPAHKADVYRARELGLMSGHDDLFDPTAPLTRQQAASIMVRLYDSLKGDE